VIDQLEEGAANETIFRDLNEWSAQANDSRASDGGVHTYLCECSDERCNAPIGLTYTEYEAVRSFPVRFAIAVNHENPELDSVVGEHARFAVVEKIGSRALALARATNPRR
jgi:hypothetical protein